MKYREPKIMLTALYSKYFKLTVHKRIERYFRNNPTQI